MTVPLEPEDLRSCLNYPSSVIATAAGLIEYADRGTGETLLAVHGTLGGFDQGLVSTEFFRVNGFRIIAPSRSGYLRTPLSTGSSPEQQGDALAALLDAIGLENTAVFAGSGGGPAAYALAARHPNRVSRLVQVDSLCMRVPALRFASLSARDPALHMQLWFLRHVTIPLLKMLLRRFGQATAQEAADRAASLAADPIRIAQLESILMASTGWKHRRDGFFNDSTTFKSMDPLSLQDIASPTLIMHGTGDATVPPENAEYAHQQIAGSQLYWMKGSHVAFFLEEADTAPGFALEWLRGIAPEQGLSPRAT